MSRKYTILVIDDEQEILDIIEEILDKKYNVIKISESSKIKEMMNYNVIDVIISDIKMPKMNGIDLLKFVKDTDKFIPVIMITGYANFLTMKKAIKYGAFDFLKKPFHYPELLNSVKQALEKRELQIANQRYKERLEEMVVLRTQNLIIANQQLEKNMIKSILAMVNALEASDKYTRGHSERVAALSLLLGEKINLNDKDKEVLMLGAILHDIGKIAIYHRVLNKTSGLNEDETRMIRTHPEIGKKIVAPIDLDPKVKEIILQHHEKWNGSGYPKKILNENINILAQIVSIADVYDAITSDRPYRDPLSKAEALFILSGMKDENFKSDLVDKFIDLMREIEDKKVQVIIKKQLYERINYYEKKSTD